MTRDVLADVEPAGERGADDLLEVVGIVVEKILANAECRVAEQDIDPLDSPQRVGDQGFATGARERVGFDNRAAAAQGPNRRGGRRQVGARGPIVDDQVGSGPRQFERASAADAAAGAGHQGRFAR